MLLILTTTHQPARDLGFLLYKHPDRHQTFDLAFGTAHVFYPEATDERTTAALLLDVDPVALVRGRGETLSQYVNDRPYVASSFMSVAISQVYGTALSGTSKDRPDLADARLPFEVKLAAVPCRRGGEGLLYDLFEPLGYEVEATRHPLDARFPEWGNSPYYTLTLKGEQRLSDLLSHLYVLIPVLDDDKHYYVAEDEIDKLFRHGQGWLDEHPAQKLITRRYLQFGSLIRTAIGRLSDEEPNAETSQNAEEERVEKPLRLHDQRMGAVMAVLKSNGAERVLDLGCGEGKLLRRLLADDRFTQITGLDVSHRALERAHERLHLDRLPPAKRDRIKLLHGSLMYKDARLSGFDAAAVVEVIEHMEPDRLDAFERVLFEHAQPRLIVVTTPNREYNVLFESMPAGSMRHRDHRFEWTRGEFRAWAEGVCERHGYTVEVVPVGPEDPAHGAPSQMGIFTR